MLVRARVQCEWVVQALPSAVSDQNPWLVLAAVGGLAQLRFAPQHELPEPLTGLQR